MMAANTKAKIAMASQAIQPVGPLGIFLEYIFMLGL